MNNPLPSSARPQQAPGINPFAQALEKARGSVDTKKNQGMPGFSDDAMGGLDRDIDPFEQQRQMMEQQKRERLRQQLHKQINPVEQVDVFKAREASVKREIDSIRHELKLLAQEVSEFHKEVEVSIMSNVGEPGVTGKYYFNFFQKLREFIRLLTQKIHSARTWATTANSKKKKRRMGAGLEISGKSYEQTQTVFDRMHHERSTVYSGS